MASASRLSSIPSALPAGEVTPASRRPSAASAPNPLRFLTSLTRRPARGGVLGPSEAELQRHLSPLLALSAGLAEAELTELYVLLSGHWRFLARYATATTRASRHAAAVGRALDGEDVGSGVSVLRGQESPKLALALVSAQPPTMATQEHLQQTLTLASVLLEAWEAQQRAEQARRWLTDLRAEVAHELRTPLTAISGFAQLLQRPGARDERRRCNFAAITVTEAQQATVVVDRILARLQAEIEELAVAESAAAE